MSAQRIEYSNDRARFSDLSAAAFRKMIADNVAWQKTPAGLAAAAEAEQRAARAKGLGIKFPDLARRKSTKPSLSTLSPADQVLVARIGII